MRPSWKTRAEPARYRVDLRPLLIDRVEMFCFRSPMKHSRGINLVADDDFRVPAPEPEGTYHAYRVEIWSEPPEAGGEIIEVIALSTSFNVSCAALKAAIRERPGKYVVHLNGKHRMSCELAPDPPAPLPLVATIREGAAYSEDLHDPQCTFATLPEWYRLAVSCGQCKHVAPLDRKELARKMGKNTLLTSLLPRLRCAKCGNRNGNSLRLGKLPR